MTSKKDSNRNDQVLGEDNTRDDQVQGAVSVSGQTSGEMNLEAQAKGLARPSGVDNTEDVERALLADEVKKQHAKELKVQEDKATADSTEDDKALPDGNSNDEPGENPGHAKGDAAELGVARKADRTDKDSKVNKTGDSK